jgi:hypothetical protein
LDDFLIRAGQHGVRMQRRVEPRRHLALGDLLAALALKLRTLCSPLFCSRVVPTIIIIQRGR